jgi:hypothetical protein
MKENAPDEYQQLAPLLSNSSTLLGKYWVGSLEDYVAISFGLQSKINVRQSIMHFLLIPRFI